MDDPRFAGKTVPDPAFAGDDGTASPAVSAVLERYAAGAASAYDVVSTLVGSRLLVPVVAVLDEDETGPDGRRQEKDSHMATVTLLNSDGRRGLLAFTSVQTLQAWRATARPVAAGMQRVAQAARQESADAVLIDVAGPVPFPLEGAALAAVAVGEQWLPAHSDPVVAAAVGRVVTALGACLSYRISDGTELGGDLLVVVAGATDPDAVQRLLAASLAADPALQQRCPTGIALSVT
ncbi:MAG: SseB family protein [Candidatus Nanopelagicales bacterium]